MRKAAEKGIAEFSAYQKKDAKLISICRNIEQNAVEIDEVLTQPDEGLTGRPDSVIARLWQRQDQLVRQVSPPSTLEGATAVSLAALSVTFRSTRGDLQYEGGDSHKLALIVAEFMAHGGA